MIRGVGEGMAYLRYVARTVKPLIDRAFRTRPERASTGIGGSSMGGPPRPLRDDPGSRHLRRRLGPLPALWYAGGAIYDWVATQPGPVGQLWLDTGVKEGDDQLDEVRRMRDLLVTRGWKLNQGIHYLEDPDGDHDEASWGRRVDEQWTRMVGMLK
ncbi:MAG: hypothetical protein V9E87_06770 [Gemmatimonadales bacterium]